MTFVDFFIKRPIFASIFNLLIVLIGVLSLNELSLREYPKVQIPMLEITAQYPNASPDLVETAVTNILEDKLAEVEGIETMTSRSIAGQSTVNLIMKAGQSTDHVMSLIRDALTAAKAELPKEVKDPHVQKLEGGTSFLPFIFLSLTHSEMSVSELTHYANIHIKNNFRNVTGVASVQMWGQPYMMKVLLDPKKLYAYGINVDEVLGALSKYNVSLPGGKLKESIPVNIDLRLSAKEDFDRIELKTIKGKPVLLKDIATITQTVDSNSFRARVQGKEGLFIAIHKATDSNPLDVSAEVRSVFSALQSQLPDQMSFQIESDQADFIRASLRNIKQSLLEAGILILLIVFLFLRSVRASLIPLVTIPVSLLGSAALLYAFGYSVNTITLLAMVLAIGLVVDDAIVVLENIHRYIEQGMKPLEAAQKGARQITFAIIAMTLTLASVYAPIAFQSGVQGQLFSEFAVALAGSVLISGIVALTLSPMMCGHLLRQEEYRSLQFMERFLKKITVFYERSLKAFLSKPWFTGVSMLGLLAVATLFYLQLPQEIAPKEDRGMVGLYFAPLPGKTIDDQDQLLKKLEILVKDIPEKKTYYSFTGNWGASLAVPLKPWEDRKRSASELQGYFFGVVQGYPSLDIWPWNIEYGLPGIDNFGASNEVAFVIRSVADVKEISNKASSLRHFLEQEKKIGDVSQDLKLDALTYDVVLDRIKLKQAEISPSLLSTTLKVFFSGDQSLNYAIDDLLYPIQIKTKTNPWSLSEIFVTNPNQKRISLSAFATLQPKVIPKEIKHYNQLRSAKISVEMKPEYTIADIMNKIGSLSKLDLPQNMTADWTGAAKAFLETKSVMTWLFLTALFFIFAILAMQFESLRSPLIILVTVPLACGGALAGMKATSQSLNIFSQVGLITLIGLITKHGIMMVEFANQRIKAGLLPEKAILESALIRLRPILMTSCAMILGAIPLAFASGAGAENRRAIGHVIVFGLAFGSFLTVYILPGVYIYAMKQRCFSIKFKKKS